MEDEVSRGQLLAAQRNEISEHYTYKWLATQIRDDRNREVTVLILILPYLLLNVYAALGTMLGLSVVIILSYNFYIATAKGLVLWPRFGAMVAISLGVACISFLVGILARKIFGMEM